MSQLFNLFGKDGMMQPVKNASLEIGQIIWLNGYGQSEHSHDRRAIYKITEGSGRKIYHWVNLDKPGKGQSDFVQHASKIFGIGTYYNDGDIATPEEITEALAEAMHEERNQQAIKEAEALAYSEFMKPWGDTQSLPSVTINRTWFKNMLQAGKLLVKCDGKYTDDYAYDAADNFGRENFYKPAPANYLTDYKLKCISIYGNKEGFINVSFASCEHYTFLVAPEYLPAAKISPKKNQSKESAPEPEQAKETAKELQETEPTTTPANIELVTYSEKAIAVFGDTKAIKSELMNLGGKFNPCLKYNDTKRAGWIFSAKKTIEIQAFLTKLTHNK